MCEYCEKGKTITDALLSQSKIKKVSNFYVLEINFSSYAKINYCPMCGIKLK